MTVSELIDRTTTYLLTVNVSKILTKHLERRIIGFDQNYCGLTHRIDRVYSIVGPGYTVTCHGREPGM